MPREHRRGSLRERLEGTFHSLGIVLCRRAWWVITAWAIVAAGLGSLAGQILVDTSPEAMLHPDDPVRLAYDAFREEFGRDELIVVGVPAPPVFDDVFLARLRALHRDLEADVPHVRNVTSLVDARYTRGENDEFVVGELLEDWQAAGRNAASLQRFAVAHPLYRDNLVSRDGDLVAFMVETEAKVPSELGEEEAWDLLEAGLEGNEAAAESIDLSPAEVAAVVDAIERVLSRHRTSDFDPVLSGTPVIQDAYDRATVRDMVQCAVGSTLGVVLILAWFFRRVSGVLLPNVVVFASTPAAFGLMAAFGAPFTLASNAVIPVLLVVGVCSSVHLLSIFYRRFEDTGDKEGAVADALGESGLPIAMTGLTTAAGLLSFASAELACVADLGRFAAAGVMLCLACTILLLPALLAVSPIRRGVWNPAASAAADRVLSGFAGFATARYRGVLLTGALLLGLGVYGASLLRFSHDPVAAFAPDDPVRADLATIDRELRGGTTLEVVIDSGRPNGLYEPALLRSLDSIGEGLREDRRALLPVSGFFSVNDVVKETNQALHANAPSEYRIPGTRQVLSQELFLFENSGYDDLERLVDSQYRLARVSIKTPYADGVVYRDFVEHVSKRFRDGLDGRSEVTITGGMALLAQAVPKALESMAEGYVLAFLTISLLMVFLMGSLHIGLIAMIPNLMPIVVAMGGMGFLDIPIDITTIMVGSIGLGLVVDDTIHFLYNYQKVFEQTRDVRSAAESALLGVGRAMAVTSVVVVVAFGADVFASLSNIVRFGLMVGSIAALALMADFLVAPALMRLLALVPRYARPASAVAVVLLALPLPADASRAREIMERVESRDDGDRVAMELHMVLLDQQGRTRARRAISYSRDREDGTDSILFFTDPPDVRDTGFLTHDHEDPSRIDDQWLFLPALGRIKRISTSEKSRPFMGSDFSYADMTRRSTERYEYRLMGEREVHGVPTWQIEAIPTVEEEAEETGYRRSIFFVRQDIDVVVRAVHWMRDSDRRKYLDVKRLERIDGIWTPVEVHMTTMHGSEIEHRTILFNRDVRYDEAIPADTFTTRRLEKGP